MRCGCNSRRGGRRLAFANVDSAEGRSCLASVAGPMPSSAQMNAASNSTASNGADSMRDQGQGSIRQRGQRSWELKFDLGRDPISGKRISRFVTFRGSKREAQAELTRLLSRKAEGTYVDPTKMTVAEYLEHWLNVDIDRRVAAKTAARHR